MKKYLVIGLLLPALAACGGNSSSTSSDSGITAVANTTAQSLTVGIPMTSFTPLTASGGLSPYSFSFTGTLPTGLSINASTGIVTGTPTAVYPTATIVFSVKDANNIVASTTSSVSFTVVDPSSSISAIANTTAQNLIVDTPMTSFSPLVASGGVPPYTFSFTGILPTGLNFDAGTGTVTGTPTAIYSSADLIFSVKDSNNMVASTSSTVNFSVTIASAGSLDTSFNTNGEVYTDFNTQLPMQEQFKSTV